MLNYDNYLLHVKGKPMNLKRLKEIPTSRLIKKIFGFDEIYSIAIRHKGDAVLDKNREAFRLVTGEKGLWYADPLIFRWKDKDFLFVEAYDRKSFRGHLEVAEINKGDFGNLLFHKVIEEQYHMSFPMTFEWNGKIFMIPETSENHSLNLYECIEFPMKWNKIREFKTGDKRFVDTILLEKSVERITLLTSEYKNDSPLMVRFQKFYLQWEKFDILIPDDEFNAKQVYNYADRNAGNLFEYEDICYLPTQVSTRVDYGVGLQIRKKNGNHFIDFMSIDKNDVIIEGLKSKNMIGIHTLSYSDLYEIIDVRYLKFSPFYQMIKILR